MPDTFDSRPGGEKLGSTLRGVIERKAEDLGLDKSSFVKEALKWQYNWIGLAGAAAFALVSGSGLPLVLAAGLELIYLSVVPQSSRFRRLVRSWQYAEEKRRHEINLSTLFQELPPDLRKRYAELDSRCRGIKANYARLSSTSQIFMSQMDERFQGLLNAYLRLLSAAQQHGEYLRTVDASKIQSEVEHLESTLKANEEASKVQEINRKRIEILNKRLDKFEKIRENRKVIDAQCGAIEDVLALIGDQSVTVRDPQEVSDQLENLMRDVEQTEQTVREVEAIFDLAAPELSGVSPVPSASPTSSTTAGSRTRLRS